MTDLTGKHALVTGGGSGIGASIATTLARAGARVTIAGRRKEALEQTAASAPNMFALVADVTDEDAIVELYKQAETVRGPFDIVVPNAGSAESAPAEKITSASWNNTLNVNLTGAFFSVRPALAGMRKRGWGRIIFIASTAGLKGYAYVAAYVAAKHGVVGLARALAAETAKDGVTVNAVCPGYTETPLLEQAVRRIALKTGRSEAEARSTIAASNPQGRLIAPQEIANVVLWLCAAESSAITGQAISVSGGETW
ncbi:MAG TPA: SDR family NAD(P)-dependent oxidoreductase [Xanthobacteraceae bacterium]|jgi:NAD(P)-dependent dehydrogenase (short-subunit alcohol dehydrogenase family)|nr:SDR family NAD(P)-dependent oxidoreductase [Xanthobacteraceae bacterium]